MQNQAIRRHVSWYEKKGDAFVADETLVGIELEELQKLFHVDKENPMCDCWEIEERHITTLQEHINHKINLQKYDYFLEATTD